MQSLLLIIAEKHKNPCHTTLMHTEVVKTPESDEKSERGSCLCQKERLGILLVDDEHSFLRVAKRILELQADFQVDTASSIEEALEKMRGKAYDVIVSDYMMPRKDGLQFLKELRDNGNNAPFIMFTVHDEVANEALSLGAYQFLSKTGDPETVYGELAYAIRQATRGIEKEPNREPS